MIKKLAAELRQFEIEISADVVEREQVFLEELLRWNQHVNLTSIKDPEVAFEKHLLDSLLLLKNLSANGRLLDMGSGGGLPGIPLAIARPGLDVISVDSVGKKISFQKHIKRLLSLSNLQPIHSRLEDLKINPLCDYVVTRALSALPNLIDWSAPLLKEGGRLLVMKGPEGEAELAEYMARQKNQQYEFEQVLHYRLPKSQSDRQLIIFCRKPH